MSQATSAAIITNPVGLFNNSKPLYIFRKPDLKPGDKDYYEITAIQVDEAYINVHGDKVITMYRPEGETVHITDWILTELESEDSVYPWINYDETSDKAKAGNAYFQERWMPVKGKPGYFSPRSVPTPMIELPEGGKLKLFPWDDWNEIQGGPGSFLAKYGKDDFDFTICTKEELINLGYNGTDKASTAKLEAVAASLQ